MIKVRENFNLGVRMSHHHHHECHDNSCSQGTPSSSPCTGSCPCCCHKHEHEDCCHFSDQLLELADDAWMELLKEKIKEQIQKTSGKNLDELAKMVNEANHQRWHELFAQQRGSESYKLKLREFFHQMGPKK